MWYSGILVERRGAMRVALLSESPADETALRALIKGVLGRVSFAPTGFRARGWPNVAQVLPSVIRHLHFNTDTEVLAVVVDSDDSVVHGAAHDAPGISSPTSDVPVARNFSADAEKIAAGGGADGRRARGGHCGAGD
jgi:hypothetical protein